VIRKNIELDPKDIIKPMVKHSGDFVTCLGVYERSRGVNNLHNINGIINHKMYIKILKKNLCQYMKIKNYQ